MLSLPLIFAPLRALIGFRSDTHRSVLGWRRVPYIWFGTLLQFGGLAIMPFALLLLSGDTTGPMWAGQIAAALAFLLVGAGLHTTQTVGLALATDLAPAHARPKVVALLCVMLLVGMMVSAVAFGLLLADFSPGAADPGHPGRGARHHRAQRPRPVEAGGARSQPGPGDAAQPNFSESWAAYAGAGRWRAAASSRPGSAPPPSRCRTSCWSPMAARSCTSRSPPPRP